MGSSRATSGHARDVISVARLVLQQDSSARLTSVLARCAASRERRSHLSSHPHHSSHRLRPPMPPGLSQGLSCQHTQNHRPKKSAPNPSLTSSIRPYTRPIIRPLADGRGGHHRTGLVLLWIYDAVDRPLGADPWGDCGRGPALGGPGFSTAFALHVFRDLICDASVLRTV